MKRYIPLLLLALAPIAYAATTYTTNYNLSKPADGDTSWGSSIRDNFDTIDTQMFANETSISEHEAETTGAHEATAISTDVGSLICTAADDVQEFLDCLDGQIGAITGGTVMTLNTVQTVTAAKTFSGAVTLSGGTTITSPFTLSSLGTGLVKTSSGVVSGALLLDADVDASAAITRSKLASGTASHVLINNGSGVMSSEAQLATSRGGTGLSTIGSANDILGVNGAGTGLEYKALTGTTNQITVSDNPNEVVFSLPQDIDQTATPSFGEITTPGIQADSSAGFVIQNSSGSDVVTFGAGPSTTASFVGILSSDTSLRLQDPGAGTDTVTIQSPTLAGSYSLTLPTDDGNANQVLGTNGSGTLSWTDATSGYSANSDTTLTASDTIAIGTGNADRLQHWVVAGNSAAITLSTSPFGTSDPQDRTIICLSGNSDSNTVTIPMNDAANGAVGNGDVTLSLYDSACFRYVSSLDRYILESKSP